MKAMLAYIRYISDGIPVGKPALGRGIPQTEAAPIPAH
jgi:cytochrome c